MPKGKNEEARDMSRIADNILQFIGPEKEQAFRDHFDSVDKDDDGILTPDELLLHFNDLGIEMDKEACNFLFEDVDANGDGKLQFEEFVVMVFHCSADLDKLRIKTADLNQKTLSEMVDGYNPLKAATTCREKTWIVFEQPNISVGARILATAIIITILISCAIMVLDSMSIYIISDIESLLGVTINLPYFFITGATEPQSVKEWATALQIIDVVCTSIFTVEFVIRISCTPDFKAFLKNGMNWIDLLAISPMFMDLGWLAYAASTDDWEFDASVFGMLKVLRMFRLVRVFKLTRYFSMIQNLFYSIKQSFSAFAFTLTSIFIIVVIASSLLFFIERGKWDPNADPPGYIRPDGTRNTPESVLGWIYWCIICMTQVGYGSGAHGSPKTGLGLFVGCLVALMNIFIYAIPISILGARFLSEDELSRRTRNIKIDRLRMIKATVQGTEDHDFVDKKIKNISAGHSMGGLENKTLHAILKQVEFESSSELHTKLSDCVKKHERLCHERFLEMHEAYQEEIMIEARLMVNAMLDVDEDGADSDLEADDSVGSTLPHHGSSQTVEAAGPLLPDKKSEQDSNQAVKLVDSIRINL